jgi:hypothetical protein
VDAKSFFIIKVSGLFSMGSGKMTLSAEFSDFRKVQGIMLPYQITNLAGDQKIAETVIEKYGINPVLRALCFSQQVITTGRFILSPE